MNFETTSSIQTSLAVHKNVENPFYYRLQGLTNPS